MVAFIIFTFLFIVMSPFCINDSFAETGFVYDIDGNKYSIQLIGNQWWITDNLRVKRYNNGDSIVNYRLAMVDNSDIIFSDGIYFTYIKPSDEFIESYGYLYNWLAVKDARGICPAGWRIPNDKDWKKLERLVLGMNRREANRFGWRGQNAGKLKEVDTTYWHAPNVGATNQLGFNGRAAGYLSYGAPLHYSRSPGRIGSWWSSTETADGLIINRELNFYNDRISRFEKSKTHAMSVRCVRNE